MQIKIPHDYNLSQIQERLLEKKFQHFPTDPNTTKGSTSENWRRRIYRSDDEKISIQATISPVNNRARHLGGQDANMLRYMSEELLKMGITHWVIFDLVFRSTGGRQITLNATLDNAEINRDPVCIDNLIAEFTAMVQHNRTDLKIEG
jgi:hypothetical protein